MKKFFRKFKKLKKFYIEPGVYLYKNGIVCNNEITDTIRFLEKFIVIAHDEEEANEIAFEKLSKKHPNWNVWLF